MCVCYLVAADVVYAHAVTSPCEHHRPTPTDQPASHDGDLAFRHVAAAVHCVCVGTPRCAPLIVRVAKVSHPKDEKYSEI